MNNNSCQTCGTDVSRRDFLKIAGASTCGIAVAALTSGEALASSNEGLPLEEHKAMLYDSTVCIGCKQCEAACKLDNNLAEEDVDDLSGNTFTIIKEYISEDGTESAFRKYQCMHCVEPSCVASCPVAALTKLGDGPVIYDEDICIGCRYCMQACPYGVPAYDWSQAYPLIRKCDLCYDRPEGPACAETCPKGALIYGKRGELIQIAKERIALNPDKYYENRVFGEHDGGGTSFLILAAVPFEKIGLPPLGNESLPSHTHTATSVVPGLFAGVAGLMSSIYIRTKDNEDDDLHEGGTT